MRKFISLLVLIAFITSATQAFAVSGGGSFKKYSFGSSSSSESKTEPAKEEKEFIVQKGSTGEKVKEIQQMLCELNFLNAKIDGSFGNVTKEAVIAFQVAKGLDSTGAVDEETYEALLVEIQIKKEKAKYAFLDELNRDELIKLRDELNIRLGEQQEAVEVIVTSEPVTTHPPTNTPKATSSSNSTIKDVVSSSFVWSSEGGIANPYDRYYFDCENMKFIREFKSSQHADTNVYSMKYVNENTIEISGLRSGYSSPAQLTLVNQNRIRITFLNSELNTGEFYLNKTDEVYTGSSVNASKSTSTAKSNKNSSLTDIEAEIFDWLTNSISEFHSPASVRVVEVLGMKDDMYYISISAKTLGGGTSNELYELEEYSCKKSMFVTINKIKNTHFTLRDSIYGREPYSSECDVGNINNALKSFCAEKGWN